MRRATVVLLLFVVLVGGVIALSRVINTQPPLTITVAVDPLAEIWVREAVARFNASRVVIGTQRVEAELAVTGDMPVWRGDAGWTAQKHPDAWVASSSVSVAYAQSANLPVQSVAASVAHTYLLWGGYASRADVITKSGTLPLDWESVSAAAKAESWTAIGGDANWQFFKLAFDLPSETMSGLGVLFTGAAYFSQTPDLTGGATRGTGFYNWMQPVINSVPNFNTLGGDVARAVSRGPSTVEIALLPESAWLANLTAMVDNEPVRLNYPAYQFSFDFPVTRWDDAQTTDDRRAAVKAFADWLLSADEQARLLDKGLRPASGDPPASASLFAAAQQYGVQLAPAVGQFVQAPVRTEAQGLIQWFVTNQRR